MQSRFCFVLKCVGLLLCSSSSVCFVLLSDERATAHLRVSSGLRENVPLLLIYQQNLLLLFVD